MNRGEPAPPAPTLHLYSPSGAVPGAAPLNRAMKRLRALGFAVHVDEAARARHQRFAGDDATRLAALHRVARAAPAVAMATRGGYGLTRLLDTIDWPLLAASVARGTRWVGYSDLTALHLGLLAHTGAPSWAGPMAVGDFGRSGDGDEDDGGVDEVTAGCFAEAMRGELEAVGFRTTPGFDGLAVRGRLWGGNLAMVVSLLGTPHFPKPAQWRGGLLFLEDVNEAPYRVERLLLQLLQAGVLGAQRAVLLGGFAPLPRSASDRGHDLKAVVAHLRQACGVPVLTGLPFGHQRTLVTLPVGVRAELVVQGRDVLLGWGD
jgi:muramoyltetrapeptide carboxypeptidase